MYIIFVFVIFVAIKDSHSISFYAGLTFNSSDLPQDFPLSGTFFEKLYISYFNTVVDNGENKVDYTYRHLDNIASGLSLFTDPVYDLDILPSNAKNKHLLGTLESWCYALTLFIFYPKLSTFTYKENNLLPYLVNRCMTLNYNLTNYKVASDFVDLLINTDTKLDDVYLFEKFSRMCPRPCYLLKDKDFKCNKTTNLRDLDLVNDFVSNPGCYLNNFLNRECTPYSDLKRRTVNSFKSLMNPDFNLHMYEDKWAYMYMPKRTELELQMENLSYLFFLKVVSIVESRNCKEIHELTKSIAIKHLSVKSIILQLDMKAEPKNRLTLSFVVTFQVDKFRTPTVNRLFDFLIKNVDFNKYYQTLLGHQSSELDTNDEKDENIENRGKDEPSTLRERYEKYREKRANKTKDDDKLPEVPDSWQNSFEFLKISGLGQHRRVGMVFKLNQATFKAFTPVKSRYYLKLTHMLDTSVYIDNDELAGSYNLLNSESEVFNLEPNPVLEVDGVATVKLKTLLTPFVDVEQPEMNSSPVIYHGYVVFDESINNYKTVAINFSLTLHTRYMHMYKTITPELTKVDNLRLLRNPVSREYSIGLVSQPNVYMLNPASSFNTVPLNYSYLRYLRFLKQISFGNFTTTHSGKPSTTFSPETHNTWIPVLFNECNNFNLSVKLCQGLRTGMAISTKVVNTYFCNPIIREMGGDVIESSCFLAFSVPVGNQDEYRFIRNVTVTTLLVCCVVPMLLVFKYFGDILLLFDRDRKSD